MSRETKTGDQTFSTVRDRFRAWRAAHPAEPSAPMLDFSEGLPLPELSEETGRVVFTATGVLIGVVLLVLMIVAITATISWTRLARDGAAVGYGLVAFFLIIAGLGGIIASINHNYRVMRRKPEHH